MCVRVCRLFPTTWLPVGGKIKATLFTLDSVAGEEADGHCMGRGLGPTQVTLVVAYPHVSRWVEHISPGGYCCSHGRWEVWVKKVFLREQR